jgi:hypothetical protein
MTSRVLKATVPAQAADVAGRLADELAFPAYADDVVSVADAGAGLHEWVLAFRGGTATWVQRSSGAVGGAGAPYRIEFEQVTGDFQDLKGAWTVTGSPAGSEIAFEVAYSTSVPHLAGAIDSAVGRVLVRTAHQVMSTVGDGPAAITAGGHFLWTLPEKTLPEKTP